MAAARAPCPHPRSVERSGIRASGQGEIALPMTPDTATARLFSDDEATLSHVLARRLADSGDKPWILTETASFTYRDVDRLACRFANGLARLGVARGDTVLLMLNNCIEFIALWC